MVSVPKLKVGTLACLYDFEGLLQVRVRYERHNPLYVFGTVFALEQEIGVRAYFRYAIERPQSTDFATDPSRPAQRLANSAKIAKLFW
jgi:hypothetical protein